MTNCLAEIQVTNWQIFSGLLSFPFLSSSRPLDCMTRKLLWIAWRCRAVQVFFWSLNPSYRLPCFIFGLLN
ncbi:hypothetical protein PAHAL_9G200200 [Panicum hallii]|uniref:Uncharacterized protein n=1 Tax=Panicum hallii TaxID=206008 RepID=A0A2T8I1V1_9POAL|nr:hypothetical protein PAHAL_9G200200 [Panicum hallii]